PVGQDQLRAGLVLGAAVVPHALPHPAEAVGRDAPEEGEDLVGHAILFISFVTEITLYKVFITGIPYRTLRNQNVQVSTGGFSVTSDNERDGLVEGGLWTVPEALEFCRLSRSDLYARMERGELAYVKIGRRRLIPRRALVELAQRNLVL